MSAWLLLRATWHHARHGRRYEYLYAIGGRWFSETHRCAKCGHMRHAR